MRQDMGDWGTGANETIELKWCGSRAAPKHLPLSCFFQPRQSLQGTALWPLIVSASRVLAL